ncbi:MAG: glutathione S-transferase family protein [Rhizobiaceae bacterium]|nr:glutathione S-transferase family protein [Rhizobiaceae bacterium]
MTDLEELVAGANAPLTDVEMNRTIGSGAPQFELYHFAFSLCSQKVRACLAEKNAAYISHDINLQMPQLGNYDPGYVRLRLAAQSDPEFATGYTGRSSVDTEGFDPAVVPTLVDHEAGIVIVDSVTICRHIDKVTEPLGALVPSDLADDVARELAIVDATPHVAVLYGAHPDVDFRPERLSKGMSGVHDRKIQKIKTARDMVFDEPALVAAYDAKIAKEEAGRNFVATPELMRASVNEIVTIIAGLEERLADNREWICGDRFTLADVIWAVSLFRLKWLGMSFLWDGGHQLNAKPQPGVASYAARLCERPAFRTAAIDWPGIARSDHVSEHYDD